MGDFFPDEFNEKEKAIKAAEYAWDHLTENEQKKCSAFYVLESVNPDEEAMDHYDGDYILKIK